MTSPPSSSSALARATPAAATAAPPASARPPVDISSGVFSGIAAFEAAQRMAQALCTSSMVPTEYRGQQGLSNSLIALEIAARMGLSPLVVMQNMTPIHGRPSWSSSFLIATVNASGRFTPLRFVFDDKDNPSSCNAVARDKATGEVLEGQTISIEMAKREGWWSRLDRSGKETSKWQSMTGQMLRYRAAAFWVKVYCPEISLGLMTQEEVADVQAVAVATAEPAAVPAPLTPSVPAPAPDQGSLPAPSAAAVPTPLPARQPAQQPAAAVATDAAAAASETDDDGRTQARTRSQAAAPRRSSRRSATAQKQAPASTETDGDGPQPAGSTPPATATDSDGIQQAGLPSAAQATSAELLSTGLHEIPRLSTAAALEKARQRVNHLLANGQLNDAGAERLWTLIDRRLQQLQSGGAEGES
jgi:hypothetical protein